MEYLDKQTKRKIDRRKSHINRKPKKKKRCKKHGCKDIHYALGWCRYHYNKETKHKYQPEGPCTIEGCETQQFSRGWCAKHYQRWRRHGDPLVVQESPIGRVDAARELLRRHEDKELTATQVVAELKKVMAR